MCSIPSFIKDLAGSVGGKLLSVILGLVERGFRTSFSLNLLCSSNHSIWTLPSVAVGGWGMGRELQVHPGSCEIL